MLLTGEADGIFELADGSLVIVDYKTAKYTATQDERLPTYVTQLNSYAVIAAHLGLGKVSKLALIYMEPITECSTSMATYCSPSGLQMHLTPKLVPVNLNEYIVHQYIHQAAVIYKTPLSNLQERTGCKDCNKTKEFLGLLSSGKPIVNYMTH